MSCIRVDCGGGKKRVIGFLDNKNRRFKKTVERSKHLFRVLDAWGLDSDFFTDVLLPGEYRIQVFDKEDKVVYEIDTEKVSKKGRYYHFKNKKIDHRAQIFCSRRHWGTMTKEDYDAMRFSQRCLV